MESVDLWHYDILNLQVCLIKSNGFQCFLGVFRDLTNIYLRFLAERQ